MSKTFPEFLLKVLLSQKCFKVLKHFVPLFEDLLKLGCSAPVDVAKLKAFAEQDPSCLKVPDLSNFSSGNQKEEKELVRHGFLDVPAFIVNGLVFTGLNSTPIRH